jgi:hypothetical protein
MRALAMGLFSILAACGGDDGSAKKDAAVDSSSHDAPHDSKVFMDGPAGTVQLTVHNYLAWCSITVAGGAESTTDVVTSVAPGTITLTAMPKPDGLGSSAFEIDGNIWHHTAGDSGTGDPGTVNSSTVTDKRLQTSTTTVVVGSSNKCVWVCCPFYPAGNGCDPATIGEQCL